MPFLECRPNYFNYYKYTAKIFLRTRGVGRDIACNVPKDKRGIVRGDSRIYLSLYFSAIVSSKY